MVKEILLVAAGGALGSAGRYLVGEGVVQRIPQAPWLGTLAVNVVGCFVMGFLYALARRHAGLSASGQLMVATGALGGFTTFSTFSLDAMRAWESGRAVLALGYVTASVVGGIAGCAAGLAAGRGP